METPAAASDRYQNFSALAAQETEGHDYRIEIHDRVRSGVLILAPHGGSIERRTSAIARNIAGDDLALYLFEGLDSAGSFETLHITSHRFDEPRCLALVAGYDTVLAIHGCAGDEPCVMLGGRDEALLDAIALALRARGLNALTDGHAYPGQHRLNICNRGKRGAGVQIELSDAFRGSPHEAPLADGIREALTRCNRLRPT